MLKQYPDGRQPGKSDTPANQLLCCDWELIEKWEGMPLGERNVEKSRSQGRTTVFITPWWREIDVDYRR